MEFRFNVNEYFKKPIVEIRSTLLPPDFVGDRRALWNTVNKVAEVINEMGEASAHAQGLNKPITTAERLRQSDQSLYLLVDSEGNKRPVMFIRSYFVEFGSLICIEANSLRVNATNELCLDIYHSVEKRCCQVD
ncbi:hypothetical protein WA026_014658 [Henosepilachna vigintioctopunctata]|uniref:N-acetyltransferase domain-containing protein n=1 Tax=Henosepilachna vigintioctopunctata TaxID=420089 RepID=A0AAW1VFQ0_9CUCU